MTEWIEIKAILEHRPDDWSLFADAFDRHGCPGSIETLSPPSISAYLCHVDGAPQVVEALSQELSRLGAISVETNIVPDEDWSSIWKLHFKPMRVGKRFVVRPTWEPFESQPNDLEIVLDPGQAFGTGDHATTRMCLEFLETYIGETTPKVLDLGAGSGILSVAAKKLGAHLVEATDIDPIATSVCIQNCELNSVKVDCFTASGFEDPRLDSKWDVIVSNIISATLIRLAPEAARRLALKGKWIVSGIIANNWPDVLAACEQAGLVLVVSKQDGDWVGAVLSHEIG